jgi:hypothetical protein
MYENISVVPENILTFIGATSSVTKSLATSFTTLRRVEKASCVIVQMLHWSVGLHTAAGHVYCITNRTDTSELPPPFY